MAAPNLVNVTSIYGKTMGASLGTSNTNMVICASNKVYKVNSIIVSNVDGTNSFDATVVFYDSSGTSNYHIAKCGEYEIHRTCKRGGIWDTAAFKIKEGDDYIDIENIPNKKSLCFWCTEKFNNNPIFIPKNKRGGSYEVYGYFCSAECATAFLFNENIDATITWERYSLLNSIYKGIIKRIRNL